VQLACSQSTPHGFTVVFLAGWQVKQSGTPRKVPLTLWGPDVVENWSSPKEHRASCSARGSLSGLLHEGVEIVPAWHVRQESESKA
jgi:hypothetical protein